MNSEFEKIKNSIVYLDWNILSYLLESNKLEERELKANICILERILASPSFNEGIALPYSLAHFLDINLGDTQRAESKLDFLEKISRSWCIQEDQRENFELRLDKMKVRDHYYWYTDNIKPIPTAEEILPPELKIAMTSSIDMFRSLSETMPNLEWRDFLYRLSRIISEPENGLESLRLNKAMRNSKSSIDGQKLLYPNLVLDNNSINPKEIKELVNSALKKSSFPFDSYSEYFQFVFPNTISILSDFENSILRLSSLADFIGITNEQLKKGTAFQGINNDLKHLVFGLRSHYFVTQDKNLRKRAKFIACWLAIETPVLNISEFNERFRKFLV